ncbi:MAG: hypothetical protein Q8O86_01860 [Dehalococcoidia bacterium]|nr:hypothetical protein [Dehalococcoidia bacterium]
MNPLGIAMAFLAFGLVSGLGVFIVVNTLPAYSRELTAEVGLVSTAHLRRSLAMFVHTLVLVVGVMLIIAGAYATYRVVYG